MSLAIVRNKIVKCQMQLILYMVLAVSLFSINKTNYGAMVNNRFVSFLEASKEYIEEGKEWVEEKKRVEKLVHIESKTPEIQIVMGTQADVETEVVEEINLRKPLGSIYIQTGKLNVRATPNGKILGTVSLGETHDYYEKEGNWLKIAYEGDEGYVYSVYGDVYDTEGNLVTLANIPEPEPVVEEPVQTPAVPAEPVQSVVTPQKDPAQMTNAELYQWVLSQIITPDMDDFAKVRAVNQYLCDHMTYDINYYTTRDALILGRGRCQGYANAFKNLMNTLGIPTDYVRGYIAGETSSTHAWNRVLIGGTYYYVDVTWNDTTGANSYLLLNEAEFNRGRAVIAYNPKTE